MPFVKISMAFSTSILFFASVSCSEIPDSPKREVREITAAEEQEIQFVDTDGGFEISIFGKVMSPDKNSHDRVMRLLGNLVADQTLIKFVRIASGIEGGGSYCIELEKYRNMQARMARVHALLMEINPPEDTRYEVKIVNNCGPAQVRP